MRQRLARPAWAGTLVAAPPMLGAAAALAPPVALAMAAVAVAAIVSIPRPLVALALVVAVEEQLSSGNLTDDSVHPLVGAGTAVFRGVVPPVAIVLLAVAFAVVLSPRRPRLVTWPAAGLGALYLWFVLLAFQQGNGAGSITQLGPLAAGVCGVPIGAAIASDDRLRRGAVHLVAGVITAKALIGLLVVLSSPATTSDDVRLLVFYDSGLAALATATLAAILITRDRLHPAGRVAAAAAAAVMLLSFRRTIWVAAVVVLLLAPVLARRRAGLVRLASWTGAVAAVAVFAAPGVTAAVADRVSDAWTTVRGSNDDVSTRDHLEDISVGYDAARHGPLLGIGVDAPQLHSLAASHSGRLYVHNEWLQTWLRGGLPALGLLAVTVTGMVGAAVGSLRRRSDVLALTAAVFLLVLPVTLLAFPSLTTAWRWSALAGLAVGILGCRSEDQDQ